MVSRGAKDGNREGEGSKESLSPSQNRVFQFIKEQFYASGSMPTLREICKSMNWTAVGSAQDVVSALIQKGKLSKDPSKARGLLLNQVEDYRAVPLLGSAPAGVALESTENHERDVLVPSFIRGPVFAVRVVGDSMINAGISDGDIAIVRQTPHARDTEIVVAMVEGEVTIKRLRQKREELWLYPENPRFHPRKIEDPSFRILGKMIGLHRYFEG